MEKNLPKTKPLYRQIYDSLESSIELGLLKAGTPLPSVAMLCEQHGVSAGTIQRAMLRLEEDGFIFRRPGESTYIVKALEAKSQDAITACIGQTVNRIRNRTNVSSPDMYRELSRQLEALPAAAKSIRILAPAADEESYHLLRQIYSNVHDIQFVFPHAKTLSETVLNKEALSAFDFIFVSSTHYNEVKDLLSIVNLPIEQINMSFSAETLFQIFQIPAQDTVGILFQSEQYLSFLRQIFLQNGQTNQIVPLFYSESVSSIDIGGCRTVLVPKFLHWNGHKKLIAQIDELRQELNVINVLAGPDQDSVAYITELLKAKLRKNDLLQRGKRYGHSN